MSLIQEFREFAVKGNVIDLAVGVVIGTAFGKITTSLVNDIIMPPIGMLINNVDFSNLKITMTPPIEGLAAVTINYGLFIQTLLNFSIIAAAMFFVVKSINRLKRKQEEVPPPAGKPAQEALLEEIRDLLARK
jgi:large conductance mechanosensitive channel